MGRGNRERYAHTLPHNMRGELIDGSVSVLSSTLTPTIHPSFPLRFVDFDTIFPNSGVGAPLPDLVIDMIGSHVGTRRPGGLFPLRIMSDGADVGR